MGLESHNKVPFRHELKYLISKNESEIIKKRLSFFMDSDIHMKNEKGYFIRSLYFDDIWNSSYEEKLAGTESRKKYRIRIYDNSDRVIKLERKRKEGQYIQKVSVRLTKDETIRIIHGDIECLKDKKDRTAQEFYYEFRTRHVRPSVIVDYNRVPYIYKYGDVRITFDSNLRSGIYVEDMFDADIPVYETMPQDQLIMEVKYTQFLPDFIHDLLAVHDNAHIAASKYVMCLEKQNELRKMRG